MKSMISCNAGTLGNHMWVTRNKLKFNNGKTKFLIWHTNNELSLPLNAILAGNKLIIGMKICGLMEQDLGRIWP